MGFLTFLDSPKEGVDEAITELAALGVLVKLITGDSSLVAQHVAALVAHPNEFFSGNRAPEVSVSLSNRPGYFGVSTNVLHQRSR